MLLLHFVFLVTFKDIFFLFSLFGLSFYLDNNCDILETWCVGEWGCIIVQKFRAPLQLPPVIEEFVSPLKWSKRLIYDHYHFKILASSS